MLQLGGVRPRGGSADPAVVVTIRRLARVGCVEDSTFYAAFLLVVHRRDVMTSREAASAARCLK